MSHIFERYERRGIVVRLRRNRPSLRRAGITPPAFLARNSLFSIAAARNAAQRPGAIGGTGRPRAALPPSPSTGGANRRQIISHNSSLAQARRRRPGPLPCRGALRSRAAAGQRKSGGAFRRLRCVGAMAWAAAISRRGSRWDRAGSWAGCRRCP